MWVVHPRFCKEVQCLFYLAVGSWGRDVKICFPVPPGLLQFS